MQLRPIKTESDYQNTLAEMERLFDAEPNSPECNRLDILTTLYQFTLTLLGMNFSKFKDCTCLMYSVHLVNWY